MANTIGNLFLSLVFFFDLLIIVLVFIFLNKVVKRKILWFIAIYCVINSITNFITIPGIIPMHLNYLSYVIFTFIEYWIFASILYIIIDNKKFRKIIIVLSVIFSAIVILHYQTGKSERIDSVPIGVETILILIYSFYYLYQEMNNVSTTFIYNRYTFWIVIGIMIYLGGSFFIYILANDAERSLLEQIWFLTFVFYIIKNIFFGIAIFMLAKTNKPPLNKNLRPYLN